MATNKMKSTITIEIKPLQSLNTNAMQNIFVIWLDQNIPEMKDTEFNYSFTKLQEIVNKVKTFTNANECISFINNIKTEKVFIISSGTLGQTIVPIVHNMVQVHTIYIFCGNKTRHEQWVKQWPKIKGVFTDITFVCEALSNAVQERYENTSSMSFVTTNSDALNINLDQIDQTCMYTQILKEIVLSINFEKETRKELINFYQEQFIDNIIGLKNINKFKQKYHDRTPIEWFTYPCFRYSVLDRALDTMEVELIIKLGFFIRDLHEHIIQLHSEQYAGHQKSKSLVVYHVQGLSQIKFDELMKTQGGLLSFNNFLLTSKNSEVSLNYAREITKNSDLVGILFVMTIDSSMPCVSFADIHNVSYHQSKEGILFSLHSIFRIEQIKNIDNNKRLWQVNSLLMNDNDLQVHALTEYIREETYPHVKGWNRLGNFLIKLNQFQKAQQMFDLMLAETSDDRKKSGIYYMLGIILAKQQKYAEAVVCYEKSIEIHHKALPLINLDLVNSYNNLGQVYEIMNRYSAALTCFEKALEIQQKILPLNHPDVATSHINIGNISNKMQLYSKALSSYEKTHEVYRKTLPANHPDLAISNGNIGLVYENQGDYAKALSFFQCAVDIGQHSLPKNHANLQLWKSKLETIRMKF